MSSVGVDVLIRLGDKLTAPLKDVEGRVAKASERLTKRLTFSAKLAGGAALSGAVAAGTKGLVSQFTDSIRQVEKAKGELATLGVRDLDVVVRRGQDMQRQLAGVTADAFVRASYDIKSGISSLTDQGVADMTASAMLVAKATKGQAEQMTSLFATSYGIFKKHMGDLTDAQFGEQFGASLAASVQMFKTDGAKMQQAIQSAGAGAANAGMAMKDQLAILGMMQQTMEAGEAGTALRSLADNAARAHEAFAKLPNGDNPVRVRILDENNMLRDMPDILADLKERYGDELDSVEAAEIASAFGTQEAMKLIQALYGQEAAVRANADALGDAAAKGAEFTQEMAKAADANWDSIMKLMSQRFDAIRMAIGERLLPVVMRLTPVIEAMTNRVFEWIDANPMLVTRIGAVVVGLGSLAAIMSPILLGAGALVSGWAMMSYGAVRLALSIATMSKWVLGAGKGLLWLGRVVLPLVGRAILVLGRALIANPIGLLITAIAGSAYLIYQNWEPIADFLSDLWGRITDSAERAGRWISGLWERYNPRQLAARAWSGLTGFFAGLWDRIGAGVVAGWDFIKAAFLNYHPLGIIITHWDSITATFAGYWDTIRSGVTEGWEAIRTALSAYGPTGLIELAWGGLTSWFGSLWDRVRSRFVEGWAAIQREVATWPSQMRQYGEQIIQRLIDGIKSKIAALAQTVRDALASLNPFGDVNVGVTVGSQARRDARRGGGVQARATGGSYRPGWLLTGEQGPELRYATESGFIAHNRALRNMMDMAGRTRELMSGIGFEGIAAGPALATVAASAPARGGAPISFSPQYNMPMTFEPGIDAEAVRAVVHEELLAAEDRAQADMRSLLHD